MKKIKRFMLLAGTAVASFALTGCDALWEKAAGEIVPERNKPTLKKENLYVSNVNFESMGNVNKDIPRPEQNSKLTYKDKFDFNLSNVHSTHYIYDLPSTGEQNLLVIPVAFKDRLNDDGLKKKIRNDITKTFFGNPTEAESNLGWESLSSFYYKSSFGQLKLNGTVSEWYDCGLTTKEFSRLKSKQEGYDPTWTILSNAVEWYKNSYGTHGTEFDKNKDGIIDGVWLVYGAENAENNLDEKDHPEYKNDRYDNARKQLFWAYTYQNYNEIDKNPRLVDPRPAHYCWSSYDFMYEGYNKDKLDYSKKIKLDAHTYCHETGHLLGLPDYYVMSSEEELEENKIKNFSPAGSVDMMDANVIDHNSYSKMQFGWVTPYCPNPDVLKAGESFQVTIKPTFETGQCLILPTSKGWNKTAFDEYLLVEYYTPTALNKSDAQHMYPNGVQGFKNPGIRLSHVDSRLSYFKVSNRLNKDTPAGYTDVIKTGSTATTFVFTDLTFSNTQLMNKYPGTLNREWQIIDSKNKINFDQDLAPNSKPYVATDDNLFHTGDSFRIGDFCKKQFPRGITQNTAKMNNNTDMNYSFTVDSINSSGATLTITYNE